MALKMSELYSSLWKSCDELRGSMDASQYKDCVLEIWQANTLVEEVAALSAKVDEHLRKMGFAW